MKRLFLILLSLFSLSSLGFTLETQWSMASEKSLKVSCNNDSVCERFCNGVGCAVVEKVCKNCVSTSVAMTFAFKEMGRAIVAKEAIDPYSLFDLLESGEFVSLTSRSVYNIVERFNSAALKRRFQALCTDGTQYPHAFFSKTLAGEIDAPQMVWCDSGVYRLERLTELSVRGSDSILY